MDDKRDYEVGYGRPPKASQFKKGKSGNPRGRPKKDPSIADVISQDLQSEGQDEWAKR